MVHNFGLNIRRLSTPLDSAFGPRWFSRRQYIFLDLLVNSTGIDNVINWLISLTDLPEVIFVNDSLLFFLLLIVFAHPYEFLFLCRCWLYGLLALLVVESVAETYGLVLCGCWRSVCGCAWFLRLLFGLLWKVCELPCRFKVVKSHFVPLLVGRFVLIVFVRFGSILIIIWIFLRLRLFLLFFFLFLLNLFLVIFIFWPLGGFFIFLNPGPPLIHKFNSALNLFLFILIHRRPIILFHHLAVLQPFLIQW